MNAVLVTLMLIGAASVGKGQFTTQNTYDRVSGLDDRLFKDNVIFEISDSSRSQCGFMCRSVRGCIAFTVTSPGAKCRGHSALMLSSASSFTVWGAETWAVCPASSLQDGFVHYPNSAIAGPAMYTGARSADDCKASCAADSQCLSLNYNAMAGDCSYYDFTALDRPSNWQTGITSTRVHYQRTCA
ncbi:hypothetical protein BaRGS_00005547 [Batillaria attramentaria]|uniref:Apple domain-containing protein n=1 Tax=Batillaria attramentaria TaxID=370345 RepID=A0ABD0LUV8_9CAEN